MPTLTRKRVILIVVGLLVLVAIVYGFLPSPVVVETEDVRRAPLQVVVEEEGETQVTDRFVVSSPVAAFARRIDLEVGDVVEQGQPLVQLEPPRSPILDPRSRAETVARVAAARAGVTQADEQVRSAEAVAERAEEERQRAERLAADETLTRQRLEQIRAEAQQADAGLAAARAAAVSARSELEAALAALEQATSGAGRLGVQSVIRAPAAGRVLAVHRRSAGHVNPGEPLVEIGDTRQLEVHVEVLSQDAVRMTTGTPVRIDRWGGDAVLDGVVQRIEPQAVTQVSSLGVEERRVRVVAALTGSEGAAAALGSNYRVLARFILWEGTSVLQVPTSALFRTDDGWAVFVVEGNVARRREVSLGQQAGLRAQVESGLQEGDVVIVHPANDIADGVRVRPSGR